MAQSEFYTDLSKYEKRMWNGLLTRKQFRLGLKALPTCALIVADEIFVPPLLRHFTAFILAVFFLLPIMLKWTGYWSKIKRSMDFYFIVKDRRFRSNERSTGRN
ncbi:hypothetical protein [Fructobacillus fructosus]|uniref:Uncharacterized protein n=1 Tax=Fructobacillus fructosus TaxID=1631 RepID=A0ABM9N026_9LACO|nr:unnamed protein product [Fructobacillus fructosus]CAK1229274.1 unnamed protein product [Fructobacillus fructosus]CAK1235447.1 unnamed protein product [Fructobacillus fructosus]CAK1246058.1 unnamed protein product [Fructobacillus fructosus]CAK1251913.1 unnamed protein product [Fructobacillus fructosus]